MSVKFQTDFAENINCEGTSHLYPYKYQGGIYLWFYMCGPLILQQVSYIKFFKLFIYDAGDTRNIYSL